MEEMKTLCAERKPQLCCNRYIFLHCFHIATISPITVLKRRPHFSLLRQQCLLSCSIWLLDTSAISMAFQLFYPARSRAFPSTIANAHPLGMIWRRSHRPTALSLPSTPVTCSLCRWDSIPTRIFRNRWITWRRIMSTCSRSIQPSFHRRLAAHRLTHSFR